MLIIIPTSEERDGLLRHIPSRLADLPTIVSSMGAASTVYAVTRSIHRLRPKHILHVGIAGAYSEELSIGHVVQVISTQLADSGAEQADGAHISHHAIVPSFNEMSPPWEDGRLTNPSPIVLPDIRQASELTVPFATGALRTLERRAALGADIESMEGAALFYACLREQQPFTSLRAISNFVEERDVSKWDIEGALEALAKVMVRVVDEMASDD